MFVPNITQLHKNRVNMDITLRLNAAQYCPRVFLCINSILRITSSIFTKTVYNKITQLVMQQKRKDGSVNPFKYQSGHAVTRHTTKLETGGGQLSCQLKPRSEDLEQLLFGPVAGGDDEEASWLHYSF